MKFRKKPVVIDAFQMTKEARVDNSNWPDWLNYAWNLPKGEPGSVYPKDFPKSDGKDKLIVCTTEGNIEVDWNDYIFQGKSGKLYPCKRDIFEKTYDNAELTPNPTETTIELKNDFKVIEEGCIYELPCYEVIDGKGIQKTGNHIEIKFVRGSKLKDEEVPKREGTLHEHLLAMMIHDLKFKNTLVPSRDTSIVINNLETAALWLLKRQIDRNAAGVQGTYKKN